MKTVGILRLFEREKRKEKKGETIHYLIFNF
jgi:hypothetical protein